MNSIQWNSPWWYIIIFLALALGVTAVLYYRSKKFEDQPKWVGYLLPALRFLSLALILVLLLNPLIESIENQEIKPTLLVARDASGSIQLSKDSTRLMNSLSQFEKATLDNKYDVQYIDFGTGVRPNEEKAFKDKGTDISSVFNYAKSQHRGRNLGGIVLMSDGIFNQGTNPLYSVDQLPAPVFSLAFGDTTENRDLLVRNVFHNEKVYQGDYFEVQIDVSANQLSGLSSSLKLERISPESTVLETRKLTISSNNYFETISMEILANRPGIHHYRIETEGLPDEVNYQNNKLDFYVEVINASTKMLLLARAPHPDVGAIQRVVENNKNYELELAYLSERPNPQLNNIDLIIYHDLPVPDPFLEKITASAQKNSLPSLFIAGPHTNIQQFNELQQVVRIMPRSRQANFVQGSLNEDFQNFTTEGFSSFDWANSPPIKSYFADFELSAGAKSLLNQRIGEVETNYPLIAVNTIPHKQAVMLGSDWWKWRLFEFVRDGEQLKFDRLFTQLFQYLSLTEDRRPLQVKTGKNLYLTNENIVFKGALLNANYETVNTPEVQIDIKDRQGRTYEYLMDRSEKAYELNIGSLPVGDYTFTASSLFNGKRLTAEGSFTIQDVQLEAYDLSARHELLYQLSEASGGAFYPAKQTDSLIAHLKKSPSAKPVLYQRSSLSKLIDYRWLLFLIALLLAMEWGLRKYFGSY